jgi:hypothetical protein
MTIHLTQRSLWTFIVRLQKKEATSTVSTEIHRGAIFDRLKIKIFVLNMIHKLFLTIR